MEEEKREPCDASQDKKPFIAFRWIIAIIIFLTITVIMFARNCLSVAIVAMVNSTSSDDEYDSDDVCLAALNKSDDTDPDTHNSEFNWTGSEQGFVLGAFFWGTLISRFFLSRLSEVFGSRETLSFGLTVGGILTFLSPLCAEVSPYLLAANRFLLGASFGTAGATFQVIFSSWAPINERGMMTTVGYSGVSAGGLLGLLVPGWLSEQFGWRSIFYFAGVLTCLMPPMWIILVRNNPRDHPMLSEYERKLLSETTKSRTQKSVPWKQIITSPYVIILVFCLFARIWMGVTLTLEGAYFLTNKLGLDLDTASYVNATNCLLTFLSSLVFGVVSDFLINRKYLSKIRTRKLFHFIGSGLGPIMLLGVTLSDCNQTAVIALWISMGFVINATIVSFSLGPLDIAPNYTAVINGLFAFGTLAGAVEPMVSSAFLKTSNGWNKVFYLSILINIVSCVFYILFMTAEVQSWNYYCEEKESLDNDNKIKSES